MLASTRILNESLHPFDPDGPATNGAIKLSGPRHRQPSWSRRKEIIYGTQAKVNPARTAARRVSLVAKLIGPATSYYYWMVERIGSRERTRFKIIEAAEALGLNRRAIERYNAQLVRLGFISIECRSYQGRITYSEYTLNSINALIQDEVHVTTKVSQRRYDKSVATKRAINKTVQTSSPPSPPNQGSEKAEAGLCRASPATAAASFRPMARRDDNQHAQQIITWLEKNETTISSLGFKYRQPTSLVKDVLLFTLGRDDTWQTFVDDIWPVLLEKIRSSSFLRNRNRSLGFGWLFMPSRSDTDEMNFQVFIMSRRYTDLATPESWFRAGSRVRVYGKSMVAIVRGFAPSSLTNYRVYPEPVTDPEDIESETYRAHISALSDAVSASGDTIVASRGISEALAIVETPAVALDDDDARKAQEDAEDEARLADHA